MSENSQNQFNNNKEKEYFSLVEISQITPYGVDYLVAMAQTGKLKSFKIDDQWYSSRVWLDNFIAKIKQQLENELPMSQETKWTNYLARPQQTVRWFNYFLVAVLSIFVYSWLVVFSLLVFYFINNNNYYVGYQFLQTTHQIYSWPIEVVLGKQTLITDEIITQKWQKLIGIDYNYNGQVAGEMDNL